MNAGIIFFTTEGFAKKLQFPYFVGLSVILFVLMGILNFIVPEVPENLKTVSKRHKHIDEEFMKENLTIAKTVVEREKTFYKVFLCPQEGESPIIREESLTEISQTADKKLKTDLNLNNLT